METTNGRPAAIRHTRRLNGQVGALPTMIATGRSAADLAQQVVPAHASLDALLIQLIALELDACPAGEAGRPAVNQLVRLALGQHGRRGLTAQTPAGATR